MTQNERRTLEGLEWCLHDVAMALAQLGCCHERHGESPEEVAKSTPPMMYREWIYCVVAKAVERERDRLLTIGSIA